MPVTESLQAILKGRDNLSGKLESIAESAEDVAGGMSEAASSAEALEGGLTDVEEKAEDADDEVSGLDRSVESLNRTFGAGIPIATGYAEALERIEDVDIDSGLSADETPHIAADGASVTEVRASINEASFLAARSAIESLPDTHEVEVEADVDRSVDVDLSSVKASIGSIRESSDPMEEFGEDTEDTTGKVRSLSAALGVLPRLLSTIARIDWGEVLLPDRDGRDGSILPDTPDAGSLEWPDRPPPEVGIPVDLRPTSIDLRNHIPDRIASAIEFDRDRLSTAVGFDVEDTPDLRGMVPDSLTTAVEFDHDRSAVSRIRDRVSEAITVPVNYVRKRVPSLSRPSPGDGDGIELAWSLPDLPDLTGIAKGIGKVGDAASDALGPVTDFFAGLAKMAGLGKVVSGLSKVAGAIGSVGSAASALAGVGGIALLGFSLGGIVSVVAAIGGLVTAIVGLGSALAGLLGVGLFTKGEELAESSQDIENAMEGIQEYVKSLQDEVRDALAPIFELEGLQGFLEGFIGGGLSAIEDYATMTSRLFEPIQGMFDRLGEVWSAEQPDFFAELEETIRAFLPMIEGFLTWFIRASPDALAYMREMGTKLLPKVVRMFSAMSGAIKPFLPGGAALASILFDLVTIFVELITPIAELLGLLSPLLELLAWGTDKVAGGIKYLSDGLSGLIARIMSAAQRADAFMLGDMLWNILIGAFETLTNAVIKGLEGLVNTVLDTIRSLPGGNEALEKVGLSEGVDFSGMEQDFSDMERDLNPNREGKQTEISEIPGAGPGESGTEPYAGSGMTINGDIIVGNAEDDLSEPDLRRLVADAMRNAEQEGRRRTTKRH